MHWPDLVNGSFELSGGLLNWVSVQQLYRDKRVQGVYVPAWGLFTLWGVWNLYYYPNLGQWASFCGGTSIVLANAVWIGLALYYRRNS